MEDKFGSASRKRKRAGQGPAESSSDESTSESEDEGALATENIDSEIMATINAIRSKDPRVYDVNSKFYNDTEAADSSQTKSAKEKPMRLQDYHRQNLLSGVTIEEEAGSVPLTYNQEQEQLKKSIVGEIHAAANASDDDDDDEEEEANGEFLTAKPSGKARASRPEVALDVDNADKDPENFLSNFMVSRAWAAPTGSNLHPFDSDDDEEERKADEFEQAYNMRFEDPAKSNEKLRSHARDMAAKYSVRREEQNPRQKKREAEKAQKEIEKQQRKEDKARLRKLKIEALEEKVRSIKRAAGMRTADILPEDWSRFVDDEWDDKQWEAEMQKRFGDDYYAEHDVASDDGEVEGTRKVRKPKFDDDIDIKDIVPDFDAEEDVDFSLAKEEATVSKRQKAKKAKEEKKQDSKKERRIIEQLVDDQLQLELNNSLPENSKSAGFRYRETSPKDFGLSSRDILLANDKQLNEFAGLKKLASFRDAEKKRKDLKHLGKKARLRKWRMETFGNEEGVQASDLIPVEDENVAGDQADGEGEVDIRTGGSRKKRRRKSKKQKTDVSEEA